MISLQQEISTLLAEVSTPHISDALDACGIPGYVHSIHPIALSKRLVGPIYPVQYRPVNHQPTEPMQASNYIDEVPAGYVLFIDNAASLACSVWGGILTHYAKRNGILGTIVHGAVRDVDTFAEHDYAVYAMGVTPQTGKNRVQLAHQRSPISVQGIRIAMNDVVVADSNGILVIPQNQLKQVLAMARNIRNTEEQIVRAVDEGVPLHSARTQFRYDTPWKK